MSDKSIVIGGGLAGLLCARRLLLRGRSFCLVDTPVTSLGSGLGGFAEFSGAKFSMLPAGRGLVPVAGSEELLQDAIRDVVGLLALERFPVVRSNEVDFEKESGLALRGYDSYVLSPEQVALLVRELASAIPLNAVIHGRVTAVAEAGQGDWCVHLDNGEEVSGKNVIFAGGRTGAALLGAAGAQEQPGKGADFGIRIEFSDRSALAPLRSFGADAKLLAGHCRTFCLNSPGSIFHYPVDPGILIPGGVVADQSVRAGNVGLLCRVDDKKAALGRFHDAVRSYPGGNAQLSYFAPNHRKVVDIQRLRVFFGEDVVQALAAFVTAIDRAGLIRFEQGCTVHYPLVDWHWSTFGVSNSFATTKPGLYVVGDLAGHARGLLQSAVSGWLSAGAL